MEVSLQPAARTSPDYLYRRHSLPVRVMHWINVVALAILLMSGLAIFGAHPALYWGKSSYTGAGPLLEITAREGAGGRPVGVVRAFGRELETTGVLGWSTGPNGQPRARAFPSWITIPGNQYLALARSWHFLFAWILVANGLAYIAYSIASRHLARDLLPARRDWRSIGRSIVDHLLLRHPRGEASKRYNVLQRLAYLAVIFVLLPLMVLMGLAMSPRLDALWPGWVDLFGGRQSARTLHFAITLLLIAFVLVHLFQVIVTGFWNNLRSMITGRYRVEPETGRGPR
jgi:thiosulfate reductase cytochrome b subunit